MAARRRTRTNSPGPSAGCDGNRSTRGAIIRTSAGVAQLAEQGFCKAQVAGSTPAPGSVPRAAGICAGLTGMAHTASRCPCARSTSGRAAPIGSSIAHPTAASTGSGACIARSCPPERLVYTWTFEAMPDKVALVTSVLDEHDGKTRLRTTTLFGSAEDRDGYLKTGDNAGAAQSMDRLAEVIRGDRPFAAVLLGRLTIAARADIARHSAGMRSLDVAPSWRRQGERAPRSPLLIIGPHWRRSKRMVARGRGIVGARFVHTVKGCTVRSLSPQVGSEWPGVGDTGMTGQPHGGVR